MILYPALSTAPLRYAVIYSTLMVKYQATKQMEAATPIFVDSVYQFLLATLVLSYA